MYFLYNTCSASTVLENSLSLSELWLLAFKLSSWLLAMLFNKISSDIGCLFMQQPPSKGNGMVGGTPLRQLHPLPWRPDDPRRDAQPWVNVSVEARVCVCVCLDACTWLLIMHEFQMKSRTWHKHAAWRCGMPFLPTNLPPTAAHKNLHIRIAICI